MAHNERPGPLPPHNRNTSIPSFANRMAKRDPQLYPLAAIMAGTVAAAVWFATYYRPKTEGVDKANPMAAPGGLMPPLTKPHSVSIAPDAVPKPAMSSK